MRLVSHMDPPSTCPQCSNEILTSFFDTIWFRPNKKEKYVFNLPAYFCAKCSELYVEPGILEARGLTGLKCTFAIELDIISYPEYYDWLEKNFHNDTDDPPLNN